MINFYSLYNKNELDMEEEYALLIWIAMNGGEYTDELKAIEHIILKSPSHAYYYAKRVIKGRWNEAEHLIMTNANVAYYYALDIIKGRWPEAESIIMTNDFLWKDYCNEFNI